MFCSSLPIRSSCLAGVPLIGSFFESNIPESASKISSFAQQSIKEAYEFMGTHLHQGEIKAAFQPALKEISPEKLKKIIDPLVDLIEEQGLGYLKCLDIFTQDNLKNLVAEAAKNVTDLNFLTDALENAKKLPVDFTVDNSTIQRTTSTFKTFFRNILHLFQATFRLDTQGVFMSIFNSNSLLDIYWKYLSIPVYMVVKLAEWLLDWTLALLIVTIIHIVLGIVLFVYNRFFSSPPSTLPRGDNLNVKLLNGKPPVWENSLLLKEFNKKLNGSKVPVIVGSSGAGKSSLAQAFAQQQITLQREGKKYKTAYVIKAPDLANSFEGMAEQLNYIHRMFLDHKQEVVIFLEEFDTALNKDDLWKLIFKYKEDHISCIPVITSKGYENAVKMSEFDTRYKPVKVDGTLTVEQVIRHHHRLNFGHVSVDDAAFKTLAEGEQQPSLGISRLEEVCGYVSNKEKMGVSIGEIRALEREIGLIQEKLANASFKEKAILRLEIAEKEKAIEIHNKKFVEINKTAEKVDKLSKRCFELRKYEHKLVRNLSHLIGQKQEQAIKEYMFISYHLLPKLEKDLEDLLENKIRNQDNYIPLQVDKALVEIAIKSMK